MLASGEALRPAHLALVLAVAVMSYLPTFWTELQHDEALWLCATRGWQRDSPTPYQAVFDNKPVMIYLGYAVALSVPLGGVTGVRLVGLLVTAATAAALAYFVARHWGRTAGLGAGIAYPLCWIQFRPHGFATEDLQTLFTVVAVALWYRANSRRSYGLFLAAGLVWGLAVVSKQPALLSLAVFAIMTLRTAHGGNDRAQRIGRMALLLCGALVAPVVFLAWLRLAGGAAAEADWVQASLPLTGSHAGIAGLGGRVKGLAKMTLMVSTLAPVLFFAVWAVVHGREDRRLQAALAWAVTELVTYIVPGTGYPHQLIPFAAAGAALAGAGVAGLISSVPDRRSIVAATVAATVLLYAGPIMLCVQQPQQLSSPILKVKSAVGMRTSLAPESQHEALGAWIASETEPGDRVVAPAQALWYADREFPGPYYTHELGYRTRLCNRWRRAFAADFTRLPPKVVVLRAATEAPPCPQVQALVRRAYQPVTLPAGLRREWEACRYAGARTGAVDGASSVVPPAID